MTSLSAGDRVTRVVLVTAALGATGALVGAVCSVVAVAVIAGIEGGIRSLTSHELFGLLSTAGSFGAVVGLVGAPALGWILLRRVPLGRAILFTALGTVVGAVGGELLHPLDPYAHAVPGVLLGAFLGFIGAGVLARLRVPRPLATSATEPYNER